MIRSSAALLVMAYHYGFWIWSGAMDAGRGGSAESYHWLAPYVWFGWVGVEIFFVLSGFVIAYSAQGARAMGFAQSRALRIFPAAWICATLTLAVRAMAREGESMHALGWAWAHSVVLAPWTESWIDGSYWTLPIELTFYTLIFVLLLLGLYRYLSGVMMALGAYSSVLCLHWTAIELGWWRSDRLDRWLAHHTRGWQTLALLMHHGMLFAVGGLLWLCLFDRITVARMVAIAVFMVGGIGEIYSEGSLIRGMSNIQEISPDTHLSIVPAAMIWLVAIGAVIFAVKQNAWISRRLGPDGMMLARKAGLMTYPLYLIHQRVGFALIHALQGVMPDLCAAGLVFCLMIGLSYVVVTYLETPLQRWLRGWLQVSHSTPKATAATAP